MLGTHLKVNTTLLMLNQQLLLSVSSVQLPKLLHQHELRTRRIMSHIWSGA